MQASDVFPGKPFDKVSHNKSDCLPMPARQKPFLREREDMYSAFKVEILKLLITVSQSVQMLPTALKSFLEDGLFISEVYLQSVDTKLH
jgi:hypothetical protein